MILRSPIKSGRSFLVTVSIATTHCEVDGRGVAVARVSMVIIANIRRFSVIKNSEQSTFTSAVDKVLVFKK